jgi:uncharacterized protein YbjQ (UPF0145 family)
MLLSTYMIITTTNTIEGKTIKEYKGLVTGEAIIGANIVKDFFAQITDIVGGRSGMYEKAIGDARTIAVNEMSANAQKLGANAVIGVDLDYETIGNMLMVNASGTAVVVE